MDFPPIKTGIPVRPRALAVGRARVVPAVLDPDRDCLSPETLDEEGTAYAFFFRPTFSIFAASSSLSKAFTFSEPAARKDAVLSAPRRTAGLVLDPSTSGCGPVSQLGVIFGVVLAAELEDADGGFIREGVLFMSTWLNTE
jgi:hypothetical protein